MVRLVRGGPGWGLGEMAVAGRGCGLLGNGDFGMIAVGELD